MRNGHTLEETRANKNKMSPGFLNGKDIGEKLAKFK